MSKAKKRPVIQSDSDDSDTGDLDQELLSLASAAKRPRPGPASASSSGSSSESGSDDEWTVGGKLSSKKKVKAKVGGGKRMALQKSAGGKLPLTHGSSSELSDEEDERDLQTGSQATSSSSNSDSDSGSSSSGSLQFDDGLDDELVGNEEDRKRLLDMTEAEREQEMYNRYEKRQAMQARFEIQRKLRRERKAKKRQQREKESKQKRMQSLREKRRMREDKTKSKAMDELKARRTADKERRAEEERQQQVQKREPLKPSEVFSSGSEDESSSSSSSASYQGDSDDEAGERSLSGLRSSASKFISTLAELNKVKLSRYRLEKWVHMPFFADTITGCFVRIGIGAHEGRMVYRICEIVGVQETQKIYTIGSTKTNKGLRLRHGLQDRLFRMEYISNSPFSDTEFTKWKAEMATRGLPLPMVAFVHKKAKQIEHSKDFSLKDEDIDRIIKEKQKFRKNPTNYAMTKSRLIRDKELAEQADDTDRSRMLTQQLEELEERAELLDKQRTKGLSAISYINERNRQGNVTRAELALKEEMAAAAGETGEDPFTRRKCQPTLVTLSRDSIVEGTPQLSGSAKEDEDITQAVVMENFVDTTTPNGKAPLMSSVAASTPLDSMLSMTPMPPKQEQASSIDDPFSAHNFDIQIDLPTQPGPVVVKATPKSHTAPKLDGPRRSLNLADYKKRRGLI